MGDTEKGSWTSRELGRHINEEQARAVERVGHTPGPWKIMRTTTRPERLFEVIQDANPFTGVGSHVTHVYVPANEANARLIAAAPELLQALRDIQHNAQVMNLAEPNRVWSAIEEVAHAAIAKATGGTDASR